MTEEEGGNEGWLLKIYFKLGLVASCKLRLVATSVTLYANYETMAEIEQQQFYEQGFLNDVDMDLSYDLEDESNKESWKQMNREHARRTRIRKKEHLKKIQRTLKQIATENNLLRKSIEDCSTASILVNLSSQSSSPSPPSPPAASPPSTAPIISPKCLSNLTADYGARKMKFEDVIDSMRDVASSTVAAEGLTSALRALASSLNQERRSPVQKRKRSNKEFLEAYRKARNRRHAKITRDRKKLFVTSIEEAIRVFQVVNNGLREYVKKDDGMSEYLKELKVESKAEKKGEKGKKEVNGETEERIIKAIVNDMNKGSERVSLAPCA
ncbi:hypothetical protein TrST_g7554 [Triparma strigata]|uniref:BZIP domain-containing protein n=1 Tax=Triparma strigata TaxID=1606541 RepID=A0A9W7AU03_9STRA|nr:hypothetical protein TrST_g7554 [Triparma strigata]